MIKKHLLCKCISSDLERSKDPLAAERPNVYEHIQDILDRFKFAAMHNNIARPCSGRSIVFIQVN